MAMKKILAEDEAIVFSARSHWKLIVWPVLFTLLVTGTVVLVLTVWMDGPDMPAWARWAVIGVGAVLVAVFGLWRIVQWLFSIDTLTNRRLISRKGVFTLEGRDIPITRVHSVSYRQTMLDRILGCGTIVVQTAGTDSDVELHDVARIEKRMLQIQEIVLDTEIPAEGTEKVGRQGPDDA